MIGSNLLLTVIDILLVILCIAVAYAIVWWALFIPIRKKQSLDKELEEQRKELDMILIQKGVEWESYTKKSEELEKVRKALLETKQKYDELKEENAKLEADKIKLKGTLSAVKKDNVSK